MALKAQHTTVTTDALTEPVTLDEIKIFLHIDANEEDDLLRSLITAARQLCELKTNRAFISQTLTSSFCYFSTHLELSRAVVAEISSVTYIDEDEAEVTVDAANYSLEVIDQGLGVVNFADDYSFPNVSSLVESSVSVNFIAGSTASETPEGIKLAIKYLVAHFFENRSPFIVGAPVIKVPLTVDSLLAQHRIIT